MPRWVAEVDLSDVFHNSDLSFIERRDEIVKRLRAHEWMEGREIFDKEIPEVFDNLVLAVNDLAEAQDIDEFDEYWDLIYDEADFDRVWIKTF